jgi:shikimate kinase
MSKVIFISGEICSGKDTMIKVCYRDEEFRQIDLGQLVREKFQTAERIFDNNLEPYFIERIMAEMKKYPQVTFVVTGLRQPTLAKKIENIFDEVEHKYLVVPRDILKKRYEARANVKDAKITFEDAIAGDQSLGMKELQYYLLTEANCDFIKNYDDGERL